LTEINQVLTSNKDQLKICKKVVWLLGQKRSKHFISVTLDRVVEERRKEMQVSPPPQRFTTVNFEVYSNAGQVGEGQMQVSSKVMGTSANNKHMPCADSALPMQIVFLI
jgi:hypothetical protein